MTEAEALDMAAKVTGWGRWVDVARSAERGELLAIRAHAATLMENAALKADNERLREALGRIAHGDRWTDPDSPQRIAKDALTALERIDHGDR